MTTVEGAGVIGLPGVIERLGVRLRRTGSGADPAVLLGLALRRNPRRAQLLVSRVLGKHMPTDPRLVRAAGLLLGGLVADALAGRAPRPLPVDLLHAAVRGDRAAVAALHAGAERAGGTGPDALVLGFAETATALGHCVAEALSVAEAPSVAEALSVAEGRGGVDYLHSTRRPVPGYATAGGFTEEHSHATEHLLLPGDPAVLNGGRPLVLVDDELSTGRTALNTITALHRVVPREHYVLAALVDVRAPGNDLPGGGLVEGVRALGARLDVVALARGEVELPADLAERARALRAELDTHREDVSPGRAGSLEAVGRVELERIGWPGGLPAGGRHGFGPAHHRMLAAALPTLAEGVARAAGLTAGERVLVLGTEELMALPLRLAQTLACAGHDVAFSTSTRSPAVVVDDSGYALRSGLAFPAHDDPAHDDPADGPGPRYAYNLGSDGDEPWDHVLVVVDPPADTAALRHGLLAALAPRARRTTVVVTP